MPIFQIDRDVIRADGTQSFQCNAKDKKEALSKFKNGNDKMVSSEVEVLDLSDIFFNNIYIADEELEEI